MDLEDFIVSNKYFFLLAPLFMLCSVSQNMDGAGMAL